MPDFHRKVVTSLKADGKSDVENFSPFILTFCSQIVENQCTANNQDKMKIVLIFAWVSHDLWCAVAHLRGHGKNGLLMMAQPNLALYHFPGACSQVTVCALEEAALEYRLELVNLSSGQQGSAGYLAVNPLGKVPCLVIDGVALSENTAILTYISLLRPEAGLFPASDDPRLRAEAVGGLSFCGATLHPAVRGILNPQRLTTGDGAPVREKSIQLAGKAFAEAEKRLIERDWWLGQWSIVDVYLNWAFGVARSGGFDTSPFPQLERLRTRLSERASFARMLERDAEARAALGM